MKLAAPDREGDTGHYRFGDIVVDAPAHTLVRAGALQQIEPKTFAVLMALLRRPGELLERDELLDLVWGHRHVTPGVLTRAIAQLRHALEDDSHNPRRSEEHTSELQSLMRTSYAVFCLKKKK